MKQTTIVFLVLLATQLSFGQKDLSITGHAVELRVYAEDPEDNFMPSVGELTTYQTPEGHGIRLDDSFEQGMEIPIYYDPMIAKLITYADSRTEAIQLMKSAIDQYIIEGAATTLPFGKFVCDHEAFISGDFNTHFVKKYYSADQIIASKKEEQAIAAAVGLKLYLEEKEKLNAVSYTHLTLPTTSRV